MADFPALREPSGRVVDAGRAMAWLAEGWKMFMAAPAIWVGITVVLAVIFVVLASVPMIGPLASNLLFPVFAGGLMMGCHEQSKGEPLRFDVMFAGFRSNTSGLLTIGIAYLVGLAVIFLCALVVGGSSALLGAAFGGVESFSVAAASIALGSLLLTSLVILALLVPLTMALWFAPPLVTLGGLPAGAALRASFGGCMKNWLPFTLYGVIVLVLLFVAMLPLGLGLLVLIPVLVASTYASYKDIFE